MSHGPYPHVGKSNEKLLRSGCIRHIKQKVRKGWIRRLGETTKPLFAKQPSNVASTFLVATLIVALERSVSAPVEGIEQLVIVIVVVVMTRRWSWISYGSGDATVCSFMIQVGVRGGSDGVGLQPSRPAEGRARRLRAPPPDGDAVSVQEGNAWNGAPGRILSRDELLSGGEWAREKRRETTMRAHGGGKGTPGSASHIIGREPAGKERQGEKGKSLAMFKSPWEPLDRESYKCVAYRVHHYLAFADVFFCVVS